MNWPMRRVEGARLAQFLNAMRHSGRRCGVLAHSQPPQAVSGPNPPHAWRMLPAEPVGYAHELYAALRELDRSAATIRAALTRDPDARFLLDRLQDTYRRRLSLTQRLLQA